MRVSVLNRGGLAVFGGSYDAKRDEAVFASIHDDTVPVTLEYASAPSSPTVTTSGMVASEPAAAGNLVTVTLSYIGEGSTAMVRAIVGGQVKNVLIRQQGPVFRDGYDTDGAAAAESGLLLMTEDGVALITEEA
jgi:hypothetical protein